MVSPFMADAEKLAAVRDALPSIGAGIQLNAADGGPLPAETAAAIAQLETIERDLGRSDGASLEEAGQRVDEARAAIAAVVGGDLDQVTLTHGAQEGLALALGAIDWQSGDAALAVVDAGGSPPDVLNGLGRRIGVDVRSVPLRADADDDALVAAVRASGAGVRAVVLPHVSALTGRVLPVGAISAALPHAQAIVDGSQAAGAVPVSVTDLGAEAYAVAGHAWLLGPTGTGGLWTRSTLDRRPEEGPDLSSFHTPSVVGLARSIGWLSMFVGLEFVHRRGRAIAGYAAERLAAIEGVTLLATPDQIATILAFRIDGWPAEAALMELTARTFAVARAVPALDAIRICPGFWTTSEEIDRVVDGVALLAGHTPETLPARRTLAMLGES